jgi:hypothetical protein
MSHLPEGEASVAATLLLMHNITPSAEKTLARQSQSYLGGRLNLAVFRARQGTGKNVHRKVTERRVDRARATASPCWHEKYLIYCASLVRVQRVHCCIRDILRVQFAGLRLVEECRIDHAGRDHRASAAEFLHLF